MHKALFFILLIFCTSTQAQLFNRGQQEKIWAAIGDSVWQAIGPYGLPPHYCGNISGRTPTGNGRVTLLWSNPKKAEQVWAGTPTGGLWLSHNWGQNWQECKTSLPLPGVLALDGLGHQLAVVNGVAANGRFNNLPYCNGVWLSTNSGKNWQQILKISERNSLINQLKFIDKERLCVVSDNFLLILSLPAGDVLHKIKLPQRSLRNHTHITLFDSNLFISLKSSVLEFSTTNYLHKTIALPENNVKDYALAAYTKENRAFAAVFQNTRSQMHLYLFDSKTGNWKKTGNWQQSGGMPLRLHYTRYDSAFWIGNEYLYQYKNGNARMASSMSMKNPDQYLHADIRAMSSISTDTGAVLWVGHDGGLSLSTNSGKSWQTTSNAPMSVAQCYALAISPHHSGRLLIGTHDCSTLLYDNENWYNLSCQFCDGGNSLFHVTNPEIWYTQCNMQLMRSENAGKSWHSLPLKTIEYDSPFIQSETEPDLILSGNWRIQRSTDGGTTFRAVGPVNRGRVTALHQSQFNPAVFFAAFVNHNCKPAPCKIDACSLWKSTDAGQTWQELILPDTLINTPARITHIQTSTRYDTEIWITAATFDTPAVFYQNQQGLVWQNFSEGLPKLPVYQFYYDRRLNLMLAGTETGLFFRSFDTRWQRVHSSLPHTLISGIEIAPERDFIYVSTFGRGVWRLKLP